MSDRANRVHKYDCLGRGKHVSTAQIVDYSIGITASVLVTVLALVYSRRALLKIQVCSFSAIPSFECFLVAACQPKYLLLSTSSAPE